MKACILATILLFGAAACASHPPLCHGRLTPINRQPVASAPHS